MPVRMLLSKLSVHAYVCTYANILLDRDRLCTLARGYLLAEEGCLLVHCSQDITEAGVYAA
jgi:hypothetical protein